MSESVRRAILAAAIAALTIAAVPACALAAEPYVAVEGAHGAGPAKYDRTWVRQFGPRSAKRVLVLVPGLYGGAGDFTLTARDIVRRVPGLQVWAWDRRSNAFEDTSAFRMGNPSAAYGYYLGGRAIGDRTFKPVEGSDVPFVRDWGLSLALGDLRKVIQKARDGGRRKVILGGHSLGASMTLAYASWDFGGRPGYKDLQGLVLIDGGSLGSFSSPSLAAVKQRLAALRRGDPFADLLGTGIPWGAGVLAELASQFARLEPGAPSVLQGFTLLPASLKPPFAVTNKAALGYAFDADSSPDFLALDRVHAGELAASGDPRGWDDGEITPIERLADAFGSEPGNATEWYFPSRLSLDVAGADALARNATARYLGLRPWHRRQVNIPLYAFETDLTHGRVLRGARRFTRASRVPYARLVFDHGQSHLDPLLATPSRNLFMDTVVPFLKRRDVAGRHR